MNNLTKEERKMLEDVFEVGHDEEIDQELR